MTAMLIEGYAALFGVPDDSGDVVRAGAFAKSLQPKSGAGPPRYPSMLLQHRSGAIAGRWTRMVEDGRGLYVRGLVDAASARHLAARQMDGLSIGFRPRLWRPRGRRGRDLIDIDLVEVSLVAEPMQPLARFTILSSDQMRAA